MTRLLRLNHSSTSGHDRRSASVSRPPGPFGWATAAGSGGPSVASIHRRPPAGEVTVDGRDTRTHPPRELADVVGVVTQDPLAGCVTDTLEEELAYGMEQLAIAPDVMRKRVEETLDLLGLADLRNRALHQLSAGQLQRVAIGAVLTAHPKVLVLDEPTSALDPTGAEEVLATITRLVHDLGVTVVMAEHRLERVVQYADSIVHLPGDGTVEHGDPTDAARAARASRRRSSSSAVSRVGSRCRCRCATRAAAPRRSLAEHRGVDAAARGRAPPASGDPVALRARGIVVRYGPVVAVRDVDLELAAGEIVALMGRNGAGKSSLLWALQGIGRAPGGRVDVGGDDPADLDAGAVARARRARAAQRRPTCCTSTRSPRSSRSADAESARRRRPGTRARSIASRPASPTTRIRAISPRASDSRWCSRCSSRRRRASSCSTNRPAASTTAPSASSRRILGDLAADGHAIVVATHDVEFVADQLRTAWS